MPGIAESRDRVGVRPHTAAERAIYVAVVLLVAWGTLAFGAVYPWAYVPLLVLASIIGLGSLLRTRGLVRLSGPSRLLVLMLAAIAAGALLQLLPLPARARVAISPATESYLRD